MKNEQNNEQNLNIDKLFEAAAYPNRSIEIQGWINQEQNESIVKDLKGQYGETLLHWASMSNLGLSIDLLNKGIDINSKDKDNRTPLDWITDRLYFVCLDSHNSESAEIKKNIIDISNYIGSRLIGMGAVAKDPLAIWILTGCWELVKMWQDNYPDSWNNIGPDNFSAIHYWSISHFASNEDRVVALNYFLENGMEVNKKNDYGITPLYVAVEQWLRGNCPEQHIKLLVKKGADPNILTQQGSNCWSLAGKESKQTLSKLEEIIDG